MRTNDFLANMAKAAFAFAAALMMSMAFTACSGNDDDDNGGGGEDTSQTIMLDGVKKTVADAWLTIHGEDNDYKLRLYLSEHSKDYLQIEGNTIRHNGKTIDLTKLEEDTDAYEWCVKWEDKGTYRFTGFGGHSSLLFKTGTMKITVDLNTGDYDVTIVNGKVHNEKDEWNDGSEHTVSVKWKGKATVSKL